MSLLSNISPKDTIQIRGGYSVRNVQFSFLTLWLDDIDFNPIQVGGGAPEAHRSVDLLPIPNEQRYKALLWWLFKLKLLPAPGEATFEIFYIKYREIGPRKKVVGLVFEAKMRKMKFFVIFLNQIIFFCCEFEFYIISAFIWGI